MYKVQEILPSQLASVFPIMQELRPHLDVDEFIQLVTAASQQDNYKIVGLVGVDPRGFEKCYALMGYRILYDLVHGKHLYIDDLVVTRDMRSQGLGALLMQYAENEARRLQCKGARLCTGVENTQAQKFYEARGWQARALAFKLKL